LHPPDYYGCTTWASNLAKASGACQLLSKTWSFLMPFIAGFSFKLLFALLTMERTWFLRWFVGEAGREVCTTGGAA
jgi:hypothetical protein